MLIRDAPVTETHHQANRIRSAPTVHLSNTMSTHSAPKSRLDSLLTKLRDFSLSLNALRCTVRDVTPQTKRQTRSHLIEPVAEQSKTELAETVLGGMDDLNGQLQEIIWQVEEDADAQAQNLMLPSNEQVMDEATNHPQMDGRSESCERQVSTQLGISEQEVSSQYQASEISSSQPAQTCDNQQPAASEDVTMTGSDLDAINSPSHSPNDGGNDTTAHGAAAVPTTPSPSKQGARVGLNTRPEDRSFARSNSAVTESSTLSTAANTSPAGSVATHITWPESSGRPGDEDEAMLDVDDAGDSAQTRQPFPGGLNRITDPCSGQDPATDDKASSPGAQSPVADGRTDQPTPSPAVSNGASSPEPKSPTACAEADRSPRSSASPPPTGDGDTRPNGKPHADDDFTKDMESAMDMLSAATKHPPMQTHSPGSGDDQHADDQHADDQQTESPSASPTSEGSDSASGGADRGIGPKTTLTPADMERLVPKLAEMEVEGDSQHFCVPLRNVDLAHLQKMVKTTDQKWQTTSVRYEAGPNGEGYARVYVSSSRPPINWEGFTAECKRPTPPEIEKIFEKFALDPPKEVVPYYTGNLDILPDERLDPGPEIMGNPELKDLHRPHHHIGAPGSGCRTHREDLTKEEEEKYFGLRSYNEVYFGTGYKLWLAIEEYHIAKFDAFIKANWECCKCDQFLSHLSLLLAPSRLRKEGIDYIVAAVGRGEAFYTLPGQQHVIINMGYCAAQSINYLPPGEKLDFSKATACSDNGMYPIAKKYGNTIPSLRELAKANKRKPHQQLSKNSSRKMTRTNTAAIQELTGIENELKNSPYRRPLLIDLENPSATELRVYKRVAAVLSQQILQQFTDLVRDWRQRQSQDTDFNDTQSPLDRALARVIRQTARSRLEKFLLRHAQKKLAEENDKAKGHEVRLRSDPAYLNDLASRHNTTKKQLQQHIQDGNDWKRVCGQRDGLLPFIFLDTYNDFKIGKEQWLELGRQKDTSLAEAFHKLLDRDDGYMSNLCAAGKVFEEMVSGAPVHFLWENDKLDLAAANISDQLKQYKRVA
ncbi:hypothetical protein IL306_002502 [Fusarium sp. DS 682]|nr:hypothetical protein IL306_002502 [Fusarium sp. DS 682]